MSQKARRKRTSISHAHLTVLRKVFVSEPFPSRTTVNRLSSEIGLPFRVIKVWFQNERAKKVRRKSSAEFRSPDFQSYPPGADLHGVDHHSLEFPESFRYSKYGPGEGSSASGSSCSAASSSRGPVQPGYPVSPNKLPMLPAPGYGMYPDVPDPGSSNGDNRYRHSPSAENLVQESPVISRYLSEELIRRQQQQQQQQHHHQQQQQHHPQLPLSRSGKQYISDHNIFLF